MAMAMTALHWHMPDVTTILIVAYSGFLRTMEALTLQRCHVEFGVSGALLVVHLPNTKSGTEKEHNNQSCWMMQALSMQ